jgi:creatinine amidohydrolase
MAKRLQDMTWEEAAETFKTVRLGIIPTGSIEQHGPHLPLGTDFLIADRLAERVGEKTDAIITPTIPIGFATYHQDFEGTLTVEPEHLAAYYADVANSLLLYGVTHLLFINGHGGNGGALTSVCRDLRDRGVPAAFVQWWQVAGGINEKWSMIGHGDISETSLMLAISGESVHLDRAAAPENKWLTDNLHVQDLHLGKFGPGFVNFYFRTGDVSDTGDFLEYGHSTTADYSISPAGATAENGEEILSAVSDYIVDLIEEFKKVEFKPAEAPSK